MSAFDSQQSKPQKPSLYPQIIDSNPDLHSPFLSVSSSSTNRYPSLSPSPPTHPNPTAPNLYPSLDMKELAENLFPKSDEEEEEIKKPNPKEETLITIPGSLLHLIDRQRSVELASGDFSVVRIGLGENTVALLARIGGVQWPLARDEAVVKLDRAHYFFSLHDPSPDNEEDDDDVSSRMLNYGLTFPSGGQEGLLRRLDGILENSSQFSVQKVEGKAAGVLATREVGPAEERSAAYWTTLAPNVEDYGSSAARLIAKGSGRVIQGILWCGDVTADRLKWGEDILRRRMDSCEKQAEVSKDAIKRMKRVKKVTKMSEGVVTGILSGVLKVSGFFTSSVVNSKVGKKFFGLLPGEVVLASLDGFAKICDAAEMAGKNVLQTSSVVTTGLVSHRYGDQAAEVTNDGMGAAGHAIGTAWAVFKIRKALNPKNAVKTSTLAKSAAKAVATEHKAKQGKK